MGTRIKREDGKSEEKKDKRTKKENEKCQKSGNSIEMRNKGENKLEEETSEGIVSAATIADGILTRTLSPLLPAWRAIHPHWWAD